MVPFQSVKFFFMSVLKSLSGADIPLPSRSLLISFLDEMQSVEWAAASNEVLDFYCDQCYRILFNLSFAITSNARDELMKMHHVQKSTKPQPPLSTASRSAASASRDRDAVDRRMAEMKFEYESLQRSWKMHRDRLQEYVMAYRDAVAKLKHSYHQRDHLCKKIESLQQEKQTLMRSMGSMGSIAPMVAPRNYGSFQFQQFHGAQPPPQPQPPPPHTQHPQHPQHPNYTAYGPPGHGSFGGYPQHSPPGVESTEMEGNVPAMAATTTTKRNSESVTGGTVQHYFSYLKSLHQQRDEMMQGDPSNPQLLSIQKEIEDCRQRIASLQPKKGGNGDPPEMGTVFGRQASSGYSWL